MFLLLQNYFTRREREPFRKKNKKCETDVVVFFVLEMEMMLVWLQIRSVGIPYEIYVKAFVLLAAKLATRGPRSLRRF